MILAVSVFGFFARIFFTVLFYAALLVGVTIGWVNYLRLPLNNYVMALLVVVVSAVWVLLTPIFWIGGKLAAGRSGGASSVSSSGVPTSVSRFFKVSLTLVFMVTLTLTVFVGSLVVAFGRHVPLAVTAEQEVGKVSFEDGGQGAYEILCEGKDAQGKVRKCTLKQKACEFGVYATALRIHPSLREHLGKCGIKEAVQLHWLFFHHERGAIPDRLDGKALFPSKGVALYVLSFVFRYLPGVGILHLYSEPVSPIRGASYRVVYSVGKGPKGARIRLVSN